MALGFHENMRMLMVSQHEARTDHLTGLGNRRKLLDDLTARTGMTDVLALFDLNGFKQYNDTFGHLAGDALLARLGASLGQFVGNRGIAYRMGGDEFCIVCTDDGDRETAELVDGARAALAEDGEGFAVSAAFGSVRLPLEASSATEALRLSDQRMYAQKQNVRGSAGEQSSGVLLKTLTERDPNLGTHAKEVAALAAAVATRLGLTTNDIERVRIAASLHDIGKIAIPDAILQKTSALTEVELMFVRRHTLIGERILHAAPALAHVSAIVRASHERFDGTGYPDGLKGSAIPLLARIVFVCDAFDAMTSERPYAAALTVDEALDELDRNAGTQFDPSVVSVVRELVEGGFVRPRTQTIAA